MTAESDEVFGPEYWKKVDVQAEPQPEGDAVVGTPEVPVDVAQLAKAMLRNRPDQPNI